MMFRRKKQKSFNKRVVLVETEHEDGFIEKNLTTLDRLEKEWGDEYRDYATEYSDQNPSLTKQVKDKGLAWFETKYRNITVNQITDPHEVDAMVAGKYDDPEMVCRSMDTENPVFVWSPELTPKEIHPKLRALGIPEEYYSARQKELSMNPIMVIAQSDYDDIPDICKAVWTKELWNASGREFPKEWIGKRRILSNGTILTEGVHFAIIPDWKRGF